LPLGLGLVGLEALTGRGLAVLLIASFACAGIDAQLKKSLPLPLDAELDVEE
jgi:hypothetical protein